MQIYFAVAVAAVSGVAVGATAIDTLRAQNKAPVFVITDFTEIADVPAFNAATKGVAAAIKDGGGRTVARSDDVIALDGPTPRRMSIVQFESAEAAKAWYASPSMKDSRDARLKMTKSRSFMIEAAGH